jgi:hypothetical protein
MDTVHFFGSACAFSLAETTKTKEDLRNVFAVLGDEQLSELQKIQQLGLTPDMMISAITNFVKQNKLMDKGEDIHKADSASL